MLWFWFPLLIGLVVFVPLMFVMAGAWLFFLALPLLVFMGAWITIAWLFIDLFHASAFLGVLLGFIIGTFAARTLAKRPLRN